VISDWVFKPKDQLTVPHYDHTSSTNVPANPSQIMSTLSGDEVNRVRDSTAENNDSLEDRSLMDQTMDQTIITVDLDSTLADVGGNIHEQSIGSQPASPLSSTPQ
jgi:hypothetical protein